MRNPRLIALFILFGSLAGALTLWQIDTSNLQNDAAAQWLQELDAHPQTPWVLFAAMVFGGVIVFPVAPVVMFAGAVHGLSAFFLAFGALMLACLLCYLLGRFAGVQGRSHGGKAERIAAFVRKRGAISSLLARFVPGFPFALQGLLLGSARVPMAAYVAGSLVSVGIIAGLYLAAGAAGAAVLDDLERAIQFGWLMPGVGLAVAGLMWRSGGTSTIHSAEGTDTDADDR